LENRKLLPDSTTPHYAFACYSTSRRLLRHDPEDFSKISVTSRRPLPQQNPSISTSSDSQTDRSVEEQQYTASSHLVQSSKSVNKPLDQSLFPEKLAKPVFGQVNENRIDLTAYNDSDRSEAILYSYTSTKAPGDAKHPIARRVTWIIHFANLFDYLRCFLRLIARFIQAGIIPFVKLLGYTKRQHYNSPTTIATVDSSRNSNPKRFYFDIQQDLALSCDRERIRWFLIAYLMFQATSVVSQLDGFAFARLHQIFRVRQHLAYQKLSLPPPLNDLQGFYRRFHFFFEIPTALSHFA